MSAPDRGMPFTKQPPKFPKPSSLLSLAVVSNACQPMLPRLIQLDQSKRCKPLHFPLGNADGRGEGGHLRGSVFVSFRNWFCLSVEPCGGPLRAWPTCSCVKSVANTALLKGGGASSAAGGKKWAGKRLLDPAGNGPDWGSNRGPKKKAKLKKKPVNNKICQKKTIFWTLASGFLTYFCPLKDKKPLSSRPRKNIVSGEVGPRLDYI